MAGIEKRIDRMFNHGTGVLSGMGRMLPTEYVPHVEERIRLLNLRARALGKLGLDDVPGEETLYVQGFNANTPMGHVIRVGGETLSPLVDCTYVFLAPSGVYMYSYRLNMIDPGYRKEVTGIFGYGDVKDIGIAEGTAVRTYGKGFAEHPVSVTFTRLVLTVGEERMYFPCTRDARTERMVEKARERIAGMKG